MRGVKKLTTEELNRISAEKFKSAPKIPVVVWLDNLRSHHNVGSFFRTADAFRVEKIILSGFTPCPPHREIHKTALGATESVSWQQISNTITIPENIKREYCIIGVEQTNRSIKLDNFPIDPQLKYALIFGNELEGIQTPLLEQCHLFIEIPQHGTKHSLNVAVCGGIVIWEFYKVFRNIIQQH